MDSQTLYTGLLFLHILLFVAWLGGDIGVFILGQHFRKRDAYPLETRLQFLKLLVLNDMAPRTAWALMVPVSLSMVAAGGWALMPGWVVGLSWALGLIWLALVWWTWAEGQGPRARALKQIQFWLTVALCLFYTGLAIAGWLELWAAPFWLWLKAGLFALIFAAAIMIDVAYKPVGPLLARLIAEGSSDATETPLLKAMNFTRIWVLGLYALLLVIGAVGTFKPEL
ncbi:MAG: hypothetical protein RIA71_08550 [Oceanicaulis sp.]